MKQFIILLSAFFIILNVSAQQTMSLKDAIIGGKTYLKPEMPEQLKWKDALYYVMIQDNNLVQYNIQDKDSLELLSLAKLNNTLKEQGLSLIHISEPTRLGMISYAVF